MANGRLKTVSFGPSFLWAIVLFCIFALAARFLFWLAAPTQTYEEKRAQTRKDKVAAITLEAEQKLYGGAKWIDKTKGTVQLPIDVAMELVINDYQQKPVHPSQVKVDDPYPYGLQTAVAAPAAAAGASPAAGAMKPGASPAAAGKPAAAMTSPVPSSVPSSSPEVKKP